MDLDSVSGVLAILAITLTSAYIHGSVGFGYAVFAMTVMPMLAPLWTCSIIITTALVPTGVAIVWQLRSHINWHRVWPSALTMVIFRQIGMHILFLVDERPLKRILGILLIALAVFLFFFQRKVKIRGCVRNGLIFGALGGLTGGMYNMAGPPLVVYFLGISDDALEYSASTNAIYLLPALFGMLSHVFVYDSYTPAIVTVSLANLLAIAAGSWLGVKTMKRLNRRLLVKLIYAYMALMGVVMTVAL